MADTIPITASLRMEATPAYVRAQYRDIDHHIRNNVHPDIHYQWEPAGPGERKIRTTFRILGVAQFDVSLLEDAPDGSFVIRYLEGTNAGMVLVHEFVSLDGGKATDVRLRADAPATIGRKVLGPLFVMGARQVMKKALHEDKVDIERGDFVPDVAAGNLERALGSLASGIAPEAARAAVTAACLVTTSDGTIDGAERAAVRAIAARLGVADGFTRAREEEFLAIGRTIAIAEHARSLGADLARNGAAIQGLTAASVAALVSHGMSVGELEALRAIAAGAGVTDAALEKIVEAADAALMAT
jgi:hypothetical protein